MNINDSQLTDRDYDLIEKNQNKAAWKSQKGKTLDEMRLTQTPYENESVVELIPNVAPVDDSMLKNKNYSETFSHSKEISMIKHKRSSLSDLIEASPAEIETPTTIYSEIKTPAYNPKMVTATPMPTLLTRIDELPEEKKVSSVQIPLIFTEAK